ncbi:MAG: sunset domain-containing protein [Microthrixaceae bacterium]
MIRRSFRIGLTLGLLGGLVFAITKMLGARPAPTPDPAAVPPPTSPMPARTTAAVTQPITPAAPAPAPVPEATAPAAPGAPVRVEPAPPKKAPAAKTTKPPANKTTAKKAPAKKKPLVALWVEPTGDVCPTSHPVKAKLASKIFHLPGMLNYDRTKPDRCYRDAGSAEGDGLRPAKR